MTRTVIFTRQPSQAGAMERHIGEAGYRVKFCPLTDFQLPVDDRGEVPAELEQLVIDLHDGAFDWLLITSPNTVRALCRLGWDPRRTEAHTRLAVTGPGTAKVLFEAGAQQEPWMPPHASARGIKDHLPEGASVCSVEGQPRIALPQSQAAGPSMRDHLTSLGWDVTHVVAYLTVDYPADPDLRILDPVEVSQAGEILAPQDTTSGDVVVLTAPSAAKRWPLSVAGPKLVAIGEPTREACGQVGLPLAGTAATPDGPGILALLETIEKLDQSG